MAALHGQSIKEFVLASTLGTPIATDAMLQLEALLDGRLKEAAPGGASSRSVGDVFAQIQREVGLKPNA